MKEIRCLKCDSKLFEYISKGSFLIEIKCRKCDCKKINLIEIVNGKIKNNYMKGGDIQ